MPSLVAFAAAVVALIGATKWIPSNRGLRKLTSAGWTSLGLATAALGASVLQTAKSIRDADTRSAQVAKLEALARTEVRQSLYFITSRFFSWMVEEGLLTEEQENAALQNQSLVPPRILDVEVRRQLAQSSSPAVAKMSSNLERRMEDLHRTLGTYGAWLSPQALTLLAKLRRSVFLGLLHSEKWIRAVSPSYGTLGQGRASGYEPYFAFWTTVADLDEELGPAVLPISDFSGIRVKRHPVVYAQPDPLYFGFVEIDSIGLKQRVVVVAASASRKFQVTGARIEGPGFVAEKPMQRSTGEWEVQVVLKVPEDAPDGALRAELVVTTDDANVQEIRVPVWANLLK